MSDKQAIPNPGSDEAILMGCICPVIDNNHGGGWRGDPNTFAIDRTCPVHLVSDYKYNSDSQEGSAT